jgi:hypothetical protein
MGVAPKMGMEMDSVFVYHGKIGEDAALGRFGVKPVRTPDGDIYDYR